MKIINNKLKNLNQEPKKNIEPGKDYRNCTFYSPMIHDKVRTLWNLTPVFLHLYSSEIFL